MVIVFNGFILALLTMVLSNTCPAFGDCYGYYGAGAVGGYGFENARSGGYYGYPYYGLGAMASYETNSVPVVGAGDPTADSYVDHTWDAGQPVPESDTECYNAQ